MALGNNNDRNAQILTIAAGKIAKRVQEGTKGAVNRTGTVGSKEFSVWELQFDYLEGYIKSVVLEEGKFGKQVLIGMEDEGETYTLRLKFGSAPCTTIVCRLENLDFTKKVKISPFNYLDDNNKERTQVGVRCGGEKVVSKYTRDGEHQLPSWEQVTFKGKKQWDNTKQLNAQAEIIKMINSKLNEAAVKAESLEPLMEEVEPDAHHDSAESAMNTEELPF